MAGTTTGSSLVAVFISEPDWVFIGFVIRADQGWNEFLSWPSSVSIAARRLLSAQFVHQGVACSHEINSGTFRTYPHRPRSV